LYDILTSQAIRFFCKSMMKMLAEIAGLALLIANVANG